MRATIDKRRGNVACVPGETSVTWEARSFDGRIDEWESLSDGHLRDRQLSGVTYRLKARQTAAVP